MCRSAQRYPGNNLGKLLKKFWLLSAGLSLTQLCLADSSSPSTWVKGPARVSLGDYGQLNLPPGYKFADGQAAVSLLKVASTGSGRLLGVITPIASEFSPMIVSGDWYMAIEYFDIGHVNDMVEWQINDDEILASLQPRIAELNKTRETRGQPPLAKAVWQIKPTYKVDARSIEWALRGDGVSVADTVLDYANRYLTRRGVLQARATVYKGGTLAGAWIQDLISALTIKRGETYEDFRAGEKMAAAGLATLAKEIPLSTSMAKSATAPPARATVEDVGGMKALWIVIGALGCVGIVGGGLLARRFRQHRGSQVAEPAGEGEAQVQIPAEAGVAASSDGNGNGNGPSNGLKLNGHGLKFARSPKPARARSNGKGALANGNGNGNGKDMKRKRMFNYHKFYTEMVLQGPSPVVADNYSAYELDPYSAAYVNGYNNGSANGNGNGRHHGNNGNGHSNGHGNGNSGTESNGASSNSNLSAAHNDLIATQRSLIEEQKRLIQEQSRLIEEKTKLLAEKDRLIERQAQLFGNQPS